MNTAQKLLSVTLVFLLLFAGAITAVADEEEDANPPDETETSGITIVLQIDNPQMTVNGETQNIDESGAAPVIQNNRTLLPVRAVVEAIGGAVDWDGASRTTTLTYGQNTIQLIIDSAAASLNGRAETLDTVPVIISDRTMLPIRFIAEGFGLDVDWNPENSIVTITNADTSSQPGPSPGSDSNTLIVYLSRTGNTQTIANEVQSATGGDIFEIETVEPYPEDYDEIIVQVQQEQADGYLPPIKGTITNMDDYEVIFIGYPIWWGTIGPPVETFLSQYDLSGKTVIPFCTHQSSGEGSSFTRIAELCPQSQVLEGFTARSSQAANSQSQVLEWLREINIVD